MCFRHFPAEILRCTTGLLNNVGVSYEVSANLIQDTMSGRGYVQTRIFGILVGFSFTPLIIKLSFLLKDSPQKRSAALV